MTYAGPLGCAPLSLQESENEGAVPPAIQVLNRYADTRRFATGIAQPTPEDTLGVMAGNILAAYHADPDVERNELLSAFDQLIIGMRNYPEAVATLVNEGVGPTIVGVLRKGGEASGRDPFARLGQYRGGRQALAHLPELSSSSAADADAAAALLRPREVTVHEL